MYVKFSSKGNYIDILNIFYTVYLENLNISFRENLEGYKSQFCHALTIKEIGSGHLETCLVIMHTPFISFINKMSFIPLLKPHNRDVWSV